MEAEPVTLGHEVSMTVVGVGRNLRRQYRVGDRFIIQADIFVDGIGYAYGYEIQGGLSQYGVIDQRIHEGAQGVRLRVARPVLDGALQRFDGGRRVAASSTTLATSNGPPNGVGVLCPSPGIATGGCQPSSV